MTIFFQAFVVGVQVSYQNSNGNYEINRLISSYIGFIHRNSGE